MPFELVDLTIDRVDLVPEGANSAAYIEIYKRRGGNSMNYEEVLKKLESKEANLVKDEIAKHKAELEKTKNEHKEELSKVNEELTATKELIAGLEEEVKKATAVYCACEGGMDSNGFCKECRKPKKQKLAFDEIETLKGLSKEAVEYVKQLKVQKTAAEEMLRKAKEEQEHAQAINKAAELKALPIEQDKLATFIKGCNTEMLEALTAINAAIESTALGEVGTRTDNTFSNNGAWAKIEAKAGEVMKRDSVTKQKAIGVVIKEHPELYKEYLKGGAN